MNRAVAWIGIALLTVCQTAHAEETGGGAPQMPPVSVEVAEVVVRPISAGRSFVGTVEPSKRSLVGSEFGGLVVAFRVEEGDHVGANDPLAELRTEILDLRIEAAKATRELARQQLQELRNGSRPEEVAQARARVAQLEADLAVRRWKEKNAQELFEKEMISEDEVRDARLAVRASELLLDAAKAAFALVEAGPRAERIAQADAELQEADAQVRLLEEEKQRYVIRAPFEGWVVKQHAEKGQWLSSGSPVAEIVALDQVDVTVEVVEDFIGRLKAGDPVRVTIDAVPDRVFTGTIHKIVPAADLRGRTFPVRIRLDNEIDGDRVLLKAGMFASATLSVGEERPALLVPKDAIVLGGFVPVMLWAVGEDGTAQPVPVTLGVAVDDLVEVQGPVKPGMRVVVKGNERVYMPGRKLLVPDAGN